jgi:hypothetical protein
MHTWGRNLAEEPWSASGVDGWGKTVSPPRGASDAFLGAVACRTLQDRGARGVGNHLFIDSDRICGPIELTRFPASEDDEYAATRTILAAWGS